MLAVPGGSSAARAMGSAFNDSWPVAPLISNL